MNLTSLYNDFISDIKICIIYNVGQSKKNFFPQVHVLRQMSVLCYVMEHLRPQSFPCGMSPGV